MIVGIGHDIVEIGRVEQIVSGPSGSRFMRRVLTEAEMASAAARGARIPEFVAGRFAAKEAVVKAFGCGIGRIVSFHDMEIIPNEQGQPCCTLSVSAWNRLGIEVNETRIHVTITHERTMASAFAVVERLKC
ncbi:holo-ACP synthase [Paenibacillus tarimensis]